MPLLNQSLAPRAGAEADWVAVCSTKGIERIAFSATANAAEAKSLPGRSKGQLAQENGQTHLTCSALPPNGS